MWRNSDWKKPHCKYRRYGADIAIIANQYRRNYKCLVTRRNYQIKWEIQNPHRRNHRYCKYRRIMQMWDTDPPSQKLQILQISQNCSNERYKTPIAESTDIANITKLSKWEIQTCAYKTFTEPRSFSIIIVDSHQIIPFYQSLDLCLKNIEILNLSFE